MASQYEITIDDLQAGLSAERLRDLTDDANAGEIDETVALQMVADEERHFHLKVAPYYAIPLRTSGGDVPEGIQELLVRGARWRLAARRPEVMNTEHGEGKFWLAERKAVDDEYALMSDPDERDRRPIARAMPAAVVESHGRARVSSEPRRFTIDNMRSWGS